MNKVDLGKMVGGALQEKFQHSFRRVMENLQDSLEELPQFTVIA